VLLVVVAAAVFVPAAAGAQERGKKPDPNPKPLWSTFPLKQDRHSGQGQTAGDVSASRPSSSSGDDGFGTLPLVGTVALAMLLAGGLAVVALRLPRTAPLTRSRRRATKPAFPLSIRPSKGGVLMSNARRRLWSRAEPDAPPDQNANKVVDRLSEYAGGESRSYAPAAEEESHQEPVAEQEAAPVDTDVPANLSAVGDEVGAVLKSAQEAAASIRQAALEEAAERRDQAEAAAVAEAAEARRARDEADAYAAETRSAADAYAEQRRQEAERESATIVAEAQSRLDAADAQAEQKMRAAEAKARERFGALETEAGRYEERLENISVVFHEMSSQLDELLHTRRSTNGDGTRSEDLDETLRPDAASSR
jgi:hypothetical protein